LIGTLKIQSLEKNTLEMLVKDNLRQQHYFKICNISIKETMRKRTIKNLQKLSKSPQFTVLEIAHWPVFDGMKKNSYRGRLKTNNNKILFNCGFRVVMAKTGVYRSVYYAGTVQEKLSYFV
jgi:hypothetical protein